MLGLLPHFVSPTCLALPVYDCMRRGPLPRCEKGSAAIPASSKGRVSAHPLPNSNEHNESANVPTIDRIASRAQLSNRRLWRPLHRKDSGHEASSVYAS
jgi:hypothetical protein